MLRTRLIAGRASGLILSAVFASIMTLASQVEVVLEPLRVDPVRPAPVTDIDAKPVTDPSARSSSPWMVRCPFCRCHPWKALP